MVVVMNMLFNQNNVHFILDTHKNVLGSLMTLLCCYSRYISGILVYPDETSTTETVLTAV